jgi:protein-tyrosine phosphatase
MLDVATEWQRSCGVPALASETRVVPVDRHSVVNRRGRSHRASLRCLCRHHLGVVERDLNWPDCVNIRDLGGIVTADGGKTAVGAVVRADNVRRLTTDGWEKARAYGVRTILDLRSDGERKQDPPMPPDFDVVAVSLFDDFDGNPAYRADLGVRLAGADVRHGYRVFYSEALIRNADKFANALRAIADARGGGILAHCVGGKDRTGVFAALLLRLVNVPMPAVVADYERSEVRLGVVDSAPAGVIEEVIRTVETRHGNVVSFFLHAGATRAEVSRVRQRLRAHF